MIIILPILLLIALLYILDVILGSASSVHDAEIGLARRPFRAERIAAGEFFKKVVPLVLLSTGLPLFFVSIPLGVGLLAASFLLFVLYPG
ncbi:MAG: hypothetical protein CVU64_23305 [Deltaproteobacteria bacterium HGW-Deltaproteobacteria-21]|nr:MAG: hypothetical protein CVU64_23305 [Deltaproteobacteria bacterium HGW-Deltaproteobacteria-21]